MAVKRVEGGTYPSDFHELAVFGRSQIGEWVFSHESEDGALAPERIPSEKQHNNGEERSHNKKQNSILDSSEDERASNEADDKQRNQRVQDHAREVLRKRV